MSSLHHVKIHTHTATLIDWRVIKTHSNSSWLSPASKSNSWKQNWKTKRDHSWKVSQKTLPQPYKYTYTDNFLFNKKRSSFFCLSSARSHSSPSHMSNSTLSESTSRISPRGRQHPPHHQHSHSAPHEHPPPPHTSSRGDGRQQRGMEGEETRRGYLSASQHHVAQSSPKRSFQHAGHSDSR